MGLSLLGQWMRSARPSRSPWPSSVDAGLTDPSRTEEAPAGSGQSAAAPEAEPRAGRHAARAALAVGLAACILLWVRWSLRDRLIVTEWLFHVPVPLVLAVSTIPLFFYRARPSLAGLALVSLMIPGLASLVSEQPRLFPVSAARNSSDPDPVRLTAWNVMSYNGGEDRIAAALSSDQPDIVCLLEGTYRSQAPDSVRHALGPDMQWASVRQMAVGSRFPIGESQLLPTATRLRAFSVLVEVPDGPVRLLLVDFPGPPRTDTGELFQELLSLQQTIEEPMVIIGDFNTPRGSWHLRHALQGLRDAYVSSRQSPRWLGSWPAGIPIYQLDHCFASPEIGIISARTGRSGLSDHRRQIIELTLTGTVPPNG
jgi:endonuclease/exonuclease/phosphatase (EEP) superfamily protein YafD